MDWPETRRGCRRGIGRASVSGFRHDDRDEEERDDRHDDGRKVREVLEFAGVDLGDRRFSFGDDLEEAFVFVDDRGDMHGGEFLLDVVGVHGALEGVGKELHAIGRRAFGRPPELEIAGRDVEFLFAGRRSIGQGGVSLGAEKDQRANAAGAKAQIF